MKANEMRIGNWAFGNKPFQITAQNIGLAFGHERIRNGEERWESIPLTEEWLLKFGFDLYEEINNEVKLYKKGLSHTVKTWYDGTFVYFKDMVDIRSDIKYVHQFQNLYFAICGEELKIKE